MKLSIRRKEQELDIRRWAIVSKGNLECVHIPEMTKASSFKGLLVDVDFIFYLARPMPGKGEDVHKDYIDPAVSGTTAILKAAAGIERVKFVIVMSSILALILIGAMGKPPVHPKGTCMLPPILTQAATDYSHLIRRGVFMSIWTSLGSRAPLGTARSTQPSKFSPI